MLRIWLNVKNKHGYFQRVPAFEGEQLILPLLRAEVAGIGCKK